MPDSDVGSSVITKVPLWGRMLMVGEAVSGWGQRVYGKSLYFLHSFPVNLKLLEKIFLINNFNLKKKRKI